MLAAICVFHYCFEAPPRLRKRLRVRKYRCVLQMRLPGSKYYFPQYRRPRQTDIQIWRASVNDSASDNSVVYLRCVCSDQDNFPALRAATTKGFPNTGRHRQKWRRQKYRCVPQMRLPGSIYFHAIRAATTNGCPNTARRDKVFARRVFIFCIL